MMISLIHSNLFVYDLKLMILPKTCYIFYSYLPIIVKLDAHKTVKIELA